MFRPSKTRSTTRAGSIGERETRGGQAGGGAEGHSCEGKRLYVVRVPLGMVLRCLFCGCCSPACYRGHGTQDSLRERLAAL